MATQALTKAQWHRAVLLDKEFVRRGDRLSYRRLADALQISDVHARQLRWAIDNQDAIRTTPEQLPASEQSELILSDLHIPYHDKAFLETVLTFADERKPDVIVLLGDIIDFYQISRFTKKPVPVKKSVKVEMEETRAFLAGLRGRYPEARIIYRLGNHEERLDSYLLSRAEDIYELVDDLLPTSLGLSTLNIELMTKHFCLGKLWRFHGHEKPRGGNPTYILTVKWKYIHDNFVVGHFHRSEQRTFTHIQPGKRFEGLAIGWGARPEAAEYAPINQWNQGFGWVDYDSQGNFRGQSYKVVDGEIY